MLTRRGFLAVAASSALAAGAAKTPLAKIEAIEHQGVLIRECGLAGERRADGVVPAHPNGLQVSANRWFLMYATRSFRGIDDDLSIAYQLRAGAPDGPILKEGFFARVEIDWNPEGGKGDYVRQLGHPVLFGVPKGARIAGKPVPSANVFVAKWRRSARLLDKKTNFLIRHAPNERLSLATQAVEWVQFRLNHAEDDIEIIQPAAVLRQKGYETGAAFCSAPVITINESFVQAVRFVRDGTQWADCMHFDGGRLACVKYAFNPAVRHYEWVETGPLFGGTGERLIEASLAHWGNDWVIGGRLSVAGVAWTRSDDPFKRIPARIHAPSPATTTPRTAYVWADGVLRLFTGDPTLSPNQKNPRDPLYCWDINPDAGFTASNRRVIFDSVAAGLPIRPEARPMIDMCKLLPHSGGRVQWIVHRVQVAAGDHTRPSSNSPTGEIPVVNDQEKAACAIYYARVHYSEALPDLWDF